MLHFLTSLSVVPGWCQGRICPYDCLYKVWTTGKTYLPARVILLAQDLSPCPNPGYFYLFGFFFPPLYQRLNGSHRVQERVIESSRSTFEYRTSGKSLIQHLVVNHWYRKWHLTFYHSARNGRTRQVCKWWRWIIACYLLLKGISCHLKGNVVRAGTFFSLCVPFCLRQAKKLENKSPSYPLPEVLPVKIGVMAL